MDKMQMNSCKVVITSVNLEFLQQFLETAEKMNLIIYL